MIDVGIACELGLEAVHLRLRVGNRGVLRQREVDEEFVAVRGRKELLLDELHAVERDAEHRHRHADGQPAPAHGADEDARERRHEAARLVVMLLHRLRQQRHAEQGREQHRDDPRQQQRGCDHHEQREGELARVAAVETDRDEARDGDERAGEHRERGGGVDGGGSLAQRVAGLQPRHHHLDGDHRIVDQKAERDDESAKRDALQRDAGILHDHEGHGQHERDRQRDHEPGPHAQAHEADHQHDRDGLEQGLGEAADRLLDHDGLIGHEVHADADGQFADDLVHLLLQRLAELQQVRAGLHADGKADGRLALEPEQRLRRVDVAAADGGDVAEAEEAVVDAQVEVAQALLRRELPRHPDADAFRAGLDDAGGRDRVLGLERLHDVLLADAEGGHLARRELQEDHLVLGADQVDLADIRHRENLGPHVLDIVAQLPLRQPVRGERVDVAVHVAEVVVEDGTHDALGQLPFDVVDHVPDSSPRRPARRGFWSCPSG